MKAFPTVNWVKQQGQPPNDEGMDLRDYFAAKAMQALLSQKDWFHNSGRWDSVEQMTEKYANEAYTFANAMMKAREL
jgi:hypothetical protein